jgi:two-component system response regulator QseB
MSARILVIEDDAAIRTMLERGLRLVGHEPTLAENLAAGRRLWGETFDVVLLDVMLPDGNGLELLAERRAAGDATPTVLLTAREETQLRERAAQVGATAFLSKPFAYRELLECVGRLAPR